MGTVIRLPGPAHRPRRRKRSADTPEPATVIILPVIRIERFTDEPPSRSQRRRRRHRASRS